ncbi:MAG: thioredoxin domain-containing protein [Pseudomonadota bacterium]
MTPTNPTLANRLGSETSPYLLQHKDNPVAWQPWDQDALKAAKTEGKPILLSIGYAACHWCHVMAHESFENDEIAATMNRLFVNIKVDREERLDLDTIYQSALALIGEQGGWPLTMFLTPDGEPFWGGTYFPPAPRFGRPGFPQVLEQLSTIYHQEPEKVANNVKALSKALSRLSKNQAADAITSDQIDQVSAHLAQNFDPTDGGIGQAPKFPQCGLLLLLWRTWKRSGNQPCRNVVELTLKKMCQGGIYDHLGGGFARYAVDRHWLVPHFEKMLYDNAQLIQCLTWAWLDTHNDLYEQRIRETIQWLKREMMALVAPDSDETCDAFAASLDADSEGQEGKFYVWSEAEVNRVLGSDAELFKAAYDVTPHGNWEGVTIFNRSHDPDLKDSDLEARLEEARKRLLAARSKRIRPGWDDKVLADWNSLMIDALATASAVFDEPGWLQMAENAFSFILDKMICTDELRHSWRQGTLKHKALLDDYANLCQAALSLHEVTGKEAYLKQCRDWVGVLDRDYWDPAGDGYFLTSDSAEGLIVRTKTSHDSAVPSGNGVMLSVLARLFYQTGEPAYLDRAESLMKAFSGELARNIFPLGAYLAGCDLLLNGTQIVIIGTRGQADCNRLLKVIFDHCTPNRILQVIAPDVPLPDGHPAQGKAQIDGAATLYLCQGQNCSLPITDADKLAKVLAGPHT